MLTYDDQNIFSGYIKQLLHSFNLPNIKIYRPGILVVAGEYYIKDDNIVKAKISTRDVNNNTFDIIDRYYYGIYTRNITKTLEIRNNIYDSYTHKYLGDYLRFLRDYKHLNLMSLYNCYSKELATGLNIVSTLKDKETGNYAFNFDSTDVNYKVYMVPVTLFNDYTIAIDSDMPIEIVCGFFGKGPITKSEFSRFYQKTYKKINRCSFKEPFVYSRLKDMADEDIISTNAVQNEENLKMFIKVPFSNNSSVVVLEGNYPIGTDFVLNKFGEDGAINKNEGYIKYNYSVTNYEKVTGEERDLNNVPLISKSQLLRINSGVNHPFADRLYEYLTDNVVTNTDNIADNVTRVQTILHNRYEEKKIVDDETYRPKKGLANIQHKGLWEDKYKNIIYDVAVQENVNNDNCDILGYFDKSIEKALGKDPDIYNINEKDYISGTKYNSTK